MYHNIIMKHGERPRAKTERNHSMKDATLTTTLTNGYPLAVNFTADPMDEQTESAAILLCDIAENPEVDFSFTLGDETGNECPITAYGRDAVSVILEYFSDDLQQEVIREAMEWTITPGADTWLKSLSWYNPEWTEL